MKKVNNDKEFVAENTSDKMDLYGVADDVETLEEAGIEFERGMTLDEFMERNKNLNIKWHIGANSAFFLVGNYDHYKERILYISCDFLENSKKRIKTLTGLLKNVKKSIPEYIDTVNRIFQGNEQYNKNLMYIIEGFEGLNDRIETNLRQMEKHLQYGMLFKPLTERYVKQVYGRIDRNGFNVIIDGSENGKYWDEEEYKKWGNKDV